MKTACAVTGLSEEAIKNIQETKKLLDERKEEERKYQKKEQEDNHGKTNVSQE